MLDPVFAHSRICPLAPAFLVFLSVIHSSILTWWYFSHLTETLNFHFQLCLISLFPLYLPPTHTFFFLVSRRHTLLFFLLPHQSSLLSLPFLPLLPNNLTLSDIGLGLRSYTMKVEMIAEEEIKKKKKCPKNRRINSMVS